MKTADPDSDPDPSRPPPGRTFKSALKWSYVMDVGRQGTTLVVTFVLARILGPGAYGIVAMAGVYIAFLQLLLAQGMMPAVIQRPNLREEHKDAAFWMVFCTSLVLTVVTVPLSGWWADLNDTPDLGPVVLALSLTLPIEGLRIVQEALMRRDLNMRPLAFRTNISVLTGGVVGLVCAFVFRNVWALVAQQLTTAVMDVVVLWAYSSWRPRFRFQRRAAKDLLGFSAGSSVASIGVFVNGRADVLITGLFFGQVAVGLYRFASRLVDTAISVTVSSLQGASLPELSRYQDDPEKFAERMTSVMRASALLSLPVLGILAGVARPLIAAVGPEWERATAPLQVLTIMGGANALSMLMGPMLQAQGRTRLLAVISWISALLSAGAFALAGVLVRDQPISRQVTAISWSRAGLYAIVFFGLAMAIIRATSRVKIRAVLLAIVPSLVAGLAAAGVGIGLSTAVDGMAHGLVLLVVTGGACAATAGLVLYGVEPRVREVVGRQLAVRGWGGFATSLHAAQADRTLWDKVLRS